jgi:hypothetical protein
MSKFWLDDITVLYKDNKYLDFVPVKEMSDIEKLNAISRSLIYLLFIMTLMQKFNEFFYLLLSFLVFIILIYKLYLFDADSSKKAFYRNNIDNFDGDNHDDQENVNNPENSVNKDNNVTSQMAFYDSNNTLVINDPNKKPVKVHFNANQLLEYHKNTARIPTIKNPLMNPELADLNSEIDPVPSNSDDKHIQNEIIDKLDKNMYRDVQDLFNVKNSQRQFYTVPVATVPSKQIEFANWLYKTDFICKRDQFNCLDYEDLRYVN